MLVMTLMLLPITAAIQLEASVAVTPFQKIVKMKESRP